MPSHRSTTPRSPVEELAAVTLEVDAWAVLTGLAAAELARRAAHPCPEDAACPTCEPDVELWLDASAIHTWGAA